MGQQMYPYAQVGRPVVRVPAKYAVLRRTKCKHAFVALIERTRTNGPKAETSYAVARSEKPILANGSLLRRLDAMRFHGGRFCKVRAPEAWHASLVQAEAKFRSLVRRGGK